MAEHDTGGEKRYYFRGRQFVFMAVGFIFAAIVIYFLGILTGIKMGEEIVVRSESPPTKVSPQPLVEKPDPSPKTLADGKLPPQDVPLKPPPAQPLAKKPAQDEGVAETISKTEKEVAPPPAKEPPLAPEKKTKPSVAPKTAPQSEVAQKKAAASQGDKPKESGRTWTVQVKAFPDADSADVWVFALKAKGYDAYRIAVTVGGKTWHRVRAGRFINRDEAEALLKSLVAKEGLKDAFLAREQKTEAAD